MRIRRKRKVDPTLDGAVSEPAENKGEPRVTSSKNRASHWVFAGIIWLMSAGISLAAFFLGLSPILAGGVLLVGIVGGYLVLGQRGKSRRKEEEALEADFVEAFSYFSVYVQNGLPVYRALELTTGFASKALAVHFQRLLAEIDEDKSLRPYLRFAELFPSPEIRQVLIAVNRMVEEGGAALYVSQFRFVFAALSKSKHQEGRERLSSRLSSLNLLPLMASGLTILLVTVAVLTMIGGYANVF